MPLYDYRCKQCARVSELLIASSAQPVCPECGCEQLERLLSATVAPGRSKRLVQSARAQAAKAGHFSNYSRAERRGAGVR